MIYEIRDYHYLPEKFEAYKTWADDAVPVLKELKPLDKAFGRIDTDVLPLDRYEEN